MIEYRSPNAPPKPDILGTILLSVLAGHKRYAHVTTIRSDSVLPGLLGMKRARSEDAIRRAFQNGDQPAYAKWLHAHLANTYNELLEDLWILDMDGTVKPLYSNRERAVRGDNPTKMGRPSLVYQTYIIASTRMGLEVEVQAGNQTDSQYAQPGLWAWPGETAARAMAAVGAGRRALGNGTNDGGLREAGSALPLQREADGEGETAPGGVVRTTGRDRSGVASQ